VRRALLALAAMTALLYAAGRLFPRFEVKGRSMLPTYAPGDRLVLNRLVYVLGQPRKGDVVVVMQPGVGRRDLKRLAFAPGEVALVDGRSRPLGADEWYVLGDNAAESTDSRQLGPVRRAHIVGKVWFRY
jgi:signal peptidase I